MALYTVTKSIHTLIDEELAKPHLEQSTKIVLTLCKQDLLYLQSQQADHNHFFTHLKRLIDEQPIQM